MRRDMSVTKNSLWVVYVAAGCAAVVLSGFLCGCNNGDAYNVATACNERGIAHGKAGRYVEGIREFKKAIAIKPDDPDVYVNMGIAYGGLEQYTDEIAAYEKAIAIKPDYAHAYYNMGFAYNKLGQHTEAIAALKKAIAIKPDYAEAYVNMGAAYGGLGQYAEEIAACKKAIAIKPDFAEAYHTRAVAHYFMRDYDKAWADVQAYQKLGFKVHPGFLAELRKASGRKE